MCLLGGTRSFGHDARGNMLGETRPDGTTVSTGYDGYGRLTSYARSAGIGTLALVYNGLDDRVTQNAGSGVDAITTRYVYDSQGRVMSEYLTSASDMRGEYIYLNPDAANDNPSPYGGDDGMNGYGLLAVATLNGGGAEIHWVHSNHLGAPILTTDATGTQIAPGLYAQAVFPGQLRTLDDLYYNRYRDYDPTTGRYVQADPIGLAGDDNPYLYALGNPVRYTDPTGEFVPLIPVVAGAVGGAAVELGSQALNNWWNGRGAFDCIDWKEVGLSAAMGGLGGGAGGIAGGAFRVGKLSQGSMKWNNVSRRYRRSEGLVGKPEELHHWFIPRKAFVGKGGWRERWGERIAN